MPKINLTLEGPESVINNLSSALYQSIKVNICPEVIYPGYELTLVETSIDYEG